MSASGQRLAENCLERDIIFQGKRIILHVGCGGVTQTNTFLKMYQNVHLKTGAVLCNFFVSKVDMAILIFLMPKYINVYQPHILISTCVLMSDNMLSITHSLLG